MDSVIDEQLPRGRRAGHCAIVRRVLRAGRLRLSTTRAGCCVRARELGLRTRLHADQMQSSGGGRSWRPRLGALSADHLGAVSDAASPRWRQAATSGRPVVATLLPITSFYLDEPDFAPARRLIERGVPGRPGHRLQPGHLARAQRPAGAGLRHPSAAAVGRRGAGGADRSMPPRRWAWRDSHGSLEDGKHADLVVWQPDSHALLPYWLGADLVAHRHQARPRRLRRLRLPHLAATARLEQDDGRLARAATTRRP